MFGGNFGEDVPMGMGMGGMMGGYGMPPRAGMSTRRFDEYYRCYPTIMFPGNERDHVNYGGKLIMPASALDILSRLHISYPMMFELINGAKEKVAHAGVLEFNADEGKIFLPYWLMQVLELEPGDLLQVKSISDLPSGSFIKLEPQSPDFLDISDPKAVLENVLRNYSCLTKGDIFTFSYNDNTYDVKVLEVKPEHSSNAIVVLETDLEVDFAKPVGYEEPKRPSGTSTPASSVAGGLPSGGVLHTQGSMAQAINYASIAPDSTQAAAGAKAVSSHFLSGGHKLSSKKTSKTPTPKPSTPVPTASSNAPAAFVRRTNGPQPLRLPPNKLFFGYAVKPVKKAEGDEKDGDDDDSGDQVEGNAASNCLFHVKYACGPKRLSTDAGRKRFRYA